MATAVMETPTLTEIRPQAGPQEAFLSSPVDIAFYGGAAGGGKTFALLIEPLRFVETVEGYGCVIFRRTSPQITNEGGLWDESQDIYRMFGAVDRQTSLDWTFPTYGNRIKFAHMEHEKDRYKWDGSQIPFIGWDQLEHFTRKQFFYLMSRNRSTCGVRPYIRGNYNPVPPDDPIGGWLHEFVGWYIDQKGYPIPERSGAIRWFVNISDSLVWYDTKEEALADNPDIPPTSFTYIMSNVYDNKILLERDPGYLARLKGLNNIDQERLLKANHLIRPEAGKVFNRSWFEVVPALPAHFDGLVRFWDFAASVKKFKKDDPDFTASVLMGVLDGVYYIIDVTNDRITPAKTNQWLKNLATQDGRHIPVRWEEEGGASGKRDSWALTTLLAGWDAMGIRPQGDKITRSRAFAAQAYAGNVRLLAGDWNNMFLNHMHMIPDGSHDDIHDAAAGSFNELTFPAIEAVVTQDPDDRVQISAY